MKSTMTLKSITLAALLGAAVCSTVWAQGGPGMGGGMGGMGGGPGMQNSGQGTGMGPGMGQGRGPGARGGRGMQFNQNNTRGWQLMTPDERIAFQNQMRSVKTFDECKALQVEHRTTMETRAKEKGTTMPVPRQNGCDVMKARGLLK